MVLVTLLLINMLIAMMGNTYQIVSEMQNEWLRQVRAPPEGSGGSLLSH